MQTRPHPRPHQLAPRAAVLLLALLSALGCPAAPAQEIPIPDGLDLKGLPADVQKLLRATIAVSEGGLNETDVALHVERNTIAGTFRLQNDDAEGVRTLTLRVYGRLGEDTPEVLLGRARTTFTLKPGEPTYIAFDDGADFESCAADAQGACGLVFDANRNARRNIDDLHDGIDPGPQALALALSPSTLQFPSGIRLGDFARQVVILENLGDSSVRLERVEVIDAPGVGIALLSSAGDVRGTPRRRLVGDALDVVIPANGELLLAVSFAPVNTFLATGAVQAVLVDEDSGVRQGVRTKIIANSDGDLRPVDPLYTPPEEVALGVGGGDSGLVQARAFPATPLFSGLAVTSDDPTSARAGLLRGTGAIASLDLGDDAARAFVVDAAFLVDVPAGFRFSSAVGGLDTDVDLAVVRLAPGGIGGLACEEARACLSENAGTSDEAVEFENTGTEPLRVAVLLSRIEADRPELANAGALTDAGDPVPFELTARLHKGPEFSDDGPLDPLHGPVEGGNTVTLRGRGFQAGARVTFSGFEAVNATYDVVDPNNTTITCQAPTGSLEVGRNPATIVIENPALDDGGDGQAATLPESYIFDPPAPRLEDVTPPFARADAPDQPIAIRGLFFSTRFGPPVVGFGGDDVDGAVVSDDGSTLVVLPPASATPTQASTVGLRVRNRVAPDEDTDGDGVTDAAVLGLSSNTLVFSYVVPNGPPPVVDSISAPEGSVDGGESVVLAGTGFRAGAVVAFGAVVIDDSQINVSGDGTALSFVTPAGQNDVTVDVTVINNDGQSGTLADAFTWRTPPPELFGVQPARISTAGGTVLLLSGAGFRDGLTVDFVRGAETVPADAATRASSSSVIVIAPPLPADAWDVRVTNPTGTPTSQPIEVFAPVGPAPSIEALVPGSGSVEGGTSLRVLGTDLDAGARITIGDAAVFAAFVPEGSPGLPAGLAAFDLVTPPSSSGAGTVLLQLINADDQTATAPFVYEAVQDPAPRITSVSPAALPAGIRVDVTINGSSFAPGAVAIVGGALAEIVGQTSTLLRLRMGQGLSEGAAVVEVRNPDGQSAFASVLVFAEATAPAPQLDFLSPFFFESDDPPSPLRIVGQNLIGGQLLIDGVMLEPFVSLDDFTVTLDPAVVGEGAHDVVLQRGEQSDRALLTIFPPDEVVQAEPVIFDVAPRNFADQDQPVLFAVAGQNLDAVIFADISGVPLDIVDLTSIPAVFQLDLAANTLLPGLHQLRVQTATGIASFDVFVVSQDGGTGGSLSPRINGVTPSSLTIGTGATAVTVQGQNLGATNFFIDNAQVFPSGTPPPTDTSVTLDLSADFLGPGAHILRATSTVDPELFDIAVVQVLPRPAPRISQLSPATLQVATGTQTVSLLGDALLAATVTLDGFVIGTTGVQADSQRDVTINTDNLSAGVHVIEVSSFVDAALGDTAVLTLTPGPTPQISAIAPEPFPANTATDLDIFGAGFVDVGPLSRVFLDGGEAFGLDFTQPGRIRVPAVSLPAGALLVEVRNPDGQRASASVLVQPPVDPPVTISLLSPSNAFVGDGLVTVGVFGSGLTGGTVRIDGVFATVTATPPTDTFIEIEIDMDTILPGTHVIEIVHFGESDIAFFTADLHPPPRIASATPSFITSGFPSPVEIQGSGFAFAETVRIDGVPVTPSFISSNVIQLTSNSAGPVGPVVLEVTNFDGQSDLFTLERRDPPTFGGLSETRAYRNGGTFLTVFGSNLDADPSVQLRIAGPPSDQFLAPVPGTLSSGSFEVLVTGGLDAGPHNVFLAPGGPFVEVAAGSIDLIDPRVSFVSVFDDGPNAVLTLSGEGLVGGGAPFISLGGTPGVNCSNVQTTGDALRCEVPLTDVAWGRAQAVELDYGAGPLPAGEAQFPRRIISDFLNDFTAAQPALPALVDLSQQALPRHRVRVVVTGFAASNLGPSASLVLDVPGAPAGSSPTFPNASEVHFTFFAGSVPKGAFPARIVDSNVTVAEGTVAFTTDAPAIVNTPADGPWTDTPAALSVEIDTADFAAVVALDEKTGALHTVTSASQNGNNGIEIDLTPLSVQPWTFCLQAPDGQVFGCAPTPTSIFAATTELEPNNTDAQATAIGLVPGSAAAASITAGSLSTDLRDRFFVAAAQNSRLIVNVLPASPFDCDQPNTGAVLRVRARGSSNVIETATIGLGGSSCPQLGLGGQSEGTVFLDEGEYVIEVSRQDGGTPGYEIVASVIPPSEPICGNGAVELGEHPDCENGLPPLCPDFSTTTCDEDTCLPHFDLCPQTSSTCGNGIVDDPAELCDGLDFSPGAGINAGSCGDFFPNASGRIRCAASCFVDASQCIAGSVCGDGKVEGNEQCDDGADADDLDGCSDDCLVSQCGDGVVQAGESCDDGNLTSGDGCSSLCQ